MINSDKIFSGLALGFTALTLLSTSAVEVRSQTQPQVQKSQTPRPQTSGTAPATVAVTGDAANNSDGDVIARAGAARLSTSEVRSFVDQLSARDQAAFERDPRLLIQAVRSLLANQLVIKEALAKKWDQQPVIAAQLERIRQESIVETYLRSVSQTPDGYPGDAEIENAYEANKTSFLVPRQFQLSQIVISQPQDADKTVEEKARKKLENVRKSLKEPNANFASIAGRESDDAEGAGKGGDLGWLREDQIRPEIRAQIIGLAVNAASDPVRLDDGWHIFKLVDTKPAYTRPLAEVRELLQQKLREERQAANRRRYVGKIVDDTPMTINEIALSKLIEPNQKSSSK